MKSADDWSKEGKYSHCSFYDSRPACDCECGNETVCPKLATFIRAIQADALRAAANSCTKFLVGDPFNGVPLRSPMPHEIESDILSLIPKEPS